MFLTYFWPYSDIYLFLSLTCVEPVPTSCCFCCLHFVHTFSYIFSCRSNLIEKNRFIRNKINCILQHPTDTHKTSRLVVLNTSSIHSAYLHSSYLWLLKVLTFVFLAPSLVWFLRRVELDLSLGLHDADSSILRAAAGHGCGAAQWVT